MTQPEPPLLIWKKSSQSDDNMVHLLQLCLTPQTFKNAVNNTINSLKFAACRIPCEENLTQTLLISKKNSQCLYGYSVQRTF